MQTIIPAIIPTSHEDLAGHLARLAPAEGIRAVQIDIVDGVFAAPASYPYGVGQHLEDLPSQDRFEYEVDLMVSDPEAVLEEWIMHGATRLTIHAESVRNLPSLMRDLATKYRHVESPVSPSFGLALSLETPPSKIEAYLGLIDYVQLMGIAHIGVQGAPFDERVITRIIELKQAHPNVVIQMDGGVSRATLPALVAAGVDRFVVGSDLWHAADLALEYEELARLVG